MWIKSLLSEVIDNTMGPSTMWCDNSSAVQLAANPVLHSRTKHIELDLYFVREQVAKGSICVNHVPSLYQRADVLTKSLSTNRFVKLRKELNVERISEVMAEEKKKKMDQRERESLN